MSSPIKQIVVFLKLQQVAAQVDMIEEPEQQRNISACIELLASLRFDQNLIQQFLRAELMRESPLYQEIIQTGMQQGEQKIVMRQLKCQIGEFGPDLQAQIQKLSTPQIEELSEALLDFSSPRDLIYWLQAHLRM
jgi:predicted transposase YdaD